MTKLLNTQQDKKTFLKPLFEKPFSSPAEIYNLDVNDALDESEDGE